MSESELPTEAPQSGRQFAEQPILRQVLACVDSPPLALDAAPFTEAVLAHAAAVAEAVGARMTVMHVLESPTAQEPMDPVEWALRHRDATAYLHDHMSRFSDLHADEVIVAGPPAERINAWAHDNAADLIVLGRGGESDGAFVRLGDTARRVAQVANASVLLVPSMQVGDKPIRYRKVLIPLDGSSRSECVLPLGLEIAAAHGAETVLVHAAPKADLIESDLLDAEAVALRDQLYRRNELAARRYLDWIRSRLPATPTTRIRLLPSGDARRALALTAAEEHADLMVLSSAGKSGHADMTLGSVADYLINRMNIPVLLVRQNRRNPPTPDHAMDTRLPSQGMM
ncbi:Nucleotide-binding universal stress protein, UspA family [Marinobacter antarcticus]|uniref:Nucleotide-binding universal stress protein, UspA family n=1 Tax=Marinobacter antarcticus TaxID=564117 RepID=A0A1M6SIL7_9GAMM|nr:universal stress protein [Marinobacter antarcticus]SHK44428.1 Nucleotide-binding universal stress protein, UspA family [Marinobacter antarcticus]